MKQASLLQWFASPTKKRKEDAMDKDNSPRSETKNQNNTSNDEDKDTITPPPAKRRKQSIEPPWPTLPGQQNVSAKEKGEEDELEKDEVEEMESKAVVEVGEALEEKKDEKGELVVLPKEEKGKEKEDPPPSPKGTTFNPFFNRTNLRRRLGKEFYEQEIVALSKALLGKIIVHKLSNGTRVSGRIVETEAYLGGDDKGAHSYQGKRTKKNNSMFLDPGTAYVYRIYQKHHCFNISSLGDGAATLIRALEPVEGQQVMRKNRGGQSKNMKDTNLCSGPGKICQALEIDRSHDGLDLITDPNLFLEDGKEVPERDIIASPRINIDYAGEWATKPLRFTIRGNPHVSVKPGAKPSSSWG